MNRLQRSKHVSKSKWRGDSWSLRKFGPHVHNEERRFAWLIRYCCDSRNGGWCMHDEAATHYVAMIDQTSLGHSFIKEHFGEAALPRVGWQVWYPIVCKATCTLLAKPKHLWAFMARSILSGIQQHKPPFFQLKLGLMHFILGGSTTKIWRKGKRRKTLSSFGSPALAWDLRQVSSSSRGFIPPLC